jgi:uncharacterized protein YciU (UPF0263 family)
MQKKKKLKLRPWVKVAMLFIFGVFAVSQIFSIMGAMASEKAPETRIIHGVVQLQLNGKAELSILENDFEGDISVDMKKDYGYFEIVSVVVKGNKIVNDYLTTGEELEEVEEEYQYSITVIRQNIMEAIYE